MWWWMQSWTNGKWTQGQKEGKSYLKYHGTRKQDYGLCICTNCLLQVSHWQSKTTTVCWKQQNLNSSSTTTRHVSAPSFWRGLKPYKQAVYHMARPYCWPCEEAPQTISKHSLGHMKLRHQGIQFMKTKAQDECPMQEAKTNLVLGRFSQLPAQALV